jgi:heme/copper-type cytochrome/quinol oxidase subunit 4
MKKIRLSKKTEQMLIGLSAIVATVISFLVAQKIKASRKAKTWIVGITALVSSLLALFLIQKRNEKGESKGEDK